MISKEEFIQRCATAKEDTEAERVRLNEQMNELRALCTLTEKEIRSHRAGVMVVDADGATVIAGPVTEVVRVLVQPA